MAGMPRHTANFSTPMVPVRLTG